MDDFKDVKPKNAKLRLKLKIREKSFGHTVVEPVCEKSHRFCKLIGTKYLNDEQLFQLKKIGFDLEVV